MTIWSLCVPAGLALAAPSLAQTTNNQDTTNVQDNSVLVLPAIPQGFDRGANVSVTERSRSDYDPLGLTVGGFLVFPRMLVATGMTSNVYLTRQGVSDAYGVVNPSIEARSDWSRHSLLVRANGAFTRYLNQSARNNNNFDLAGLGRLDVNTAILVNFEAQYAEISENPDSGAVSANLAALSRYKRNYFRLGAQYQAGQARVIVSLDRSQFDFNNITLQTGQFIDQSDRGRKINRASLQLEYAPTPSFYLYTQGSYSRTSYDRDLLSGLANRDSDSYRILAGANFDLTGLFRGKLGIGYTSRNYDSPLYKTASGLSAEGKLEYFPTELTTVTAAVARTLEDASIGTVSAYFDNRVSLRVDHELLRNLLLGAEARYSRQHYLAIITNQSGYAFSGNAKYLASHFWTVEARIGFTHRNETTTSIPYSEARGEISLRYAL